MRLNRYLAACGLGSRRSCESIITAGRVSINGSPCVELSTQVEETDQVVVDDRPVSPQRETTLLLHKPAGCLCTRNDPKARKTIYDLLPDHLQKLNYVGRLDHESEGMLVMTNDGALAQQLTHPRFKVDKEYLIVLDRAFKREDAARFIEGIQIEEGLARAVSVVPISPRRLSVVLNQGYKRQLRQMFAAIDYEIKKLIRIRIGGLELGELRSGRWRVLQPEEIRQLTRSSGERTKRRAKRESTRPRGS